MATKRSDNGLIKLVKRAVRIGWDVIERGRLRIFWQFNRTKRKFYIAVGISLGKLIEPKFGQWLRPDEFGQMFADAAHWIG